MGLPEVSRIMNKSVQTLRRLIKKGDLNAKRIKTPQGFQYVVNPDVLSQMGYNISVKPVFYNSTIQNVLAPQEEAVEDVSPYQAENLYSRIEFVPHADTDFYHLDLQEPKMLHDSNRDVDLAKLAHEEKMFLYSILERLQSDLGFEKEKKNIFGRVFRRLCNRIILAIKRHSS